MANNNQSNIFDNIKWDNFDWNDINWSTDTSIQNDNTNVDIEYLFNHSSKNEFTEFLTNDYNGKIKQLLSTEGIEIAKNSPMFSERINYILTFSKYKEDIVSNPQIIKLMFKDIGAYYANLKYLSVETSLIIFNQALETNNDMLIRQLFQYLNQETQEIALNKLTFHSNILAYLISNSSPSIVNKIINNQMINLANPNINYRQLFEHAKELQGKAKEAKNTNDISIETIAINPRLLTKEVAKSIFEKYNIFQVRKIINDATYCTDSNILNEYIKKQEDLIISSAGKETLVSPYKEIFDLLKQITISEEKKEYEKADNYQKQLRNILNCQIPKHEEEAIRECLRKDTKRVLQELEILSNFKIANIIIDYHFEENFHNVMIDIEELLNLYYSGNINLPEEKLYLYQDIRNIDYLTREQQIELYEKLKNINIIEMFYDDMSYARKIVRQALKDSALTKEELLQYKDEELSEEYGVDVYSIQNNPFFAIVKSGKRGDDYLPTGHSYSLVGNGGIATWQDTNNYVYDSEDLNPDQIIHLYPYDSYTLAKPNSLNSSPTTRINVLMMPDELVEYDYSYNEILILEKGSKETDIDESIPKLKRIAKYCVDKITEQDIKEAQIQGIGILFINSKECTKSDNKERGLYRHRLKPFESQGEIVNYFDGDYHLERYEVKR